MAGNQQTVQTVEQTLYELVLLKMAPDRCTFFLTTGIIVQAVVDRPLKCLCKRPKATVILSEHRLTKQSD